MTEESRAEKRRAFGLLMQGIEDGWQMPPTALQKAVDACVWALESPEVGVRERLRAAENLHTIAARREERLLEVAKFQESLITVDAKIEHEQQMNEIFPDITTLMKQERDKQSQSKK